MVDPPAGGLLSNMIVYAIFNKERNKIYIGQTSNLDKRVARHNKALATKKAGFTAKNDGVWEVVYAEEASDRSSAMRREKELKSFRGREFIWNMIQRKDSE